MKSFVTIAALLAPSIATANPRVANTDPKAEEPCVAWVDDKCVARGTPRDVDDDAAPPPATAPAFIGEPRHASAPVATTPNPVQTEPLPTDFGTVLGRMTLEAISTLKQGEETAVAGVRGQATTQQVVEAVMASEQTLQASIAIRDKVVSAYLEISRMTI